MIFFKKNWKKEYFKKKIRGVEAMILDLEFKRFKTKEIREGVRVEYDDLKAKIGLLDQEIAKEKETPTISKDELARLEDRKVVMTRDMERFLEQLQSMDLDVEGSKPNAQYPDGVQGIAQQLDALRELKIMMRDYIPLL